MEVYNNVKKVDLNGEIYRDMVFDYPIIKSGKMMPLKRKESYSGFYSQEENEKRALRRAKTCITDYVKTNVDLVNFVTYTLDAQKIDRYNEQEIYKKMRDWLSNRVRRKGLKYVLVPEMHKDGAWHFHGFTNLALDWSYGFYLNKEIKSTRQRDNGVRYITSYVKKDMTKFNGRRYLHSRNLEKPIKIYDNVDFDSFEGKLLELEDISVRMKIK